MHTAQSRQALRSRQEARAMPRPGDARAVPRRAPGVRCAVLRCDAHLNLVRSAMAPLTMVEEVEAKAHPNSQVAQKRPGLAGTSEVNKLW